MKKLVAFTLILGLGLFFAVGCQKPAATTPPAEKPAAGKAADMPAEKPADKPAEKPAEKK